jgi:hypothetical protein
MKQPLKTDLENIKEAFRRYSCFEGKESGKMILLAFPVNLTAVVTRLFCLHLTQHLKSAY